MATKTFYFKDATAAGSVMGSLQEGGTAPTAATTTTGWNVGKTAAGNFAYMDYGANLGSGTFTTTDMFANLTSNVALSNTTVGRAWRSENRLNGTFAAANATNFWAFSPLWRTNVVGTHSGRLNVKVYKTPNANGTSNVTVVSQTSTKLTFGNTGAMISTTTDYPSSFNWTTAPAFSMYNEYLFIECQWETTIAGNNNNNGAYLRTGATCNVVTTDFTPRNKAASIG